MTLRFWFYVALWTFVWCKYENLYAQEALSLDFVQIEENLSHDKLIIGEDVIIQGLDKITGRVFTLRTPLGKSVNFGRLQMVVRRCYKTLPEDIPESIAEIEIFENLPETKEKVLVFRNLMYASSPSVSALDHPVYDVWIKECI